jgi:hypothetical protein
VKIQEKNNADAGHYVAACCGDLTQRCLLSVVHMKARVLHEERVKLVQSICHTAVSNGCEMLTIRQAYMPALGPHPGITHRGKNSDVRSGAGVRGLLGQPRFPKTLNQQLRI